MNIKEIETLLRLMKIDYSILVDDSNVYTITFPKPLLVDKLSSEAVE